MRKLRLVLCAICLILTSAVSASAIQLQLGPFGVKFTDNTYTDFNYPAILGGKSGLPLHPAQGQRQSGNVWGIMALTSIHSLTDGNPENNALGVPAYYNPGSDGKLYYGVYGGLTYLSDTGGVPGQIRLASTAGGAYLKLYEVSVADAGVYNTARIAGPNVAGAGAFGTFGNDIINAPSAKLVLDTVFSPGTLAYYDALYQPGEVELITLSSSVTGSAEAYLDIIGGTLADSFATGVFPLAFPAGTDRADLKVISDLTAQYNPITGKWNSNWTSNSQDPITGDVVPEPGTMMLLGSGLIGFAGICRKKLKK